MDVKKLYELIGDLADNAGRSTAKAKSAEGKAFYNGKEEAYDIIREMLEEDYFK